MQPDATKELNTLLSERIVILDGAMGTTIREYELTEEDTRGERFANNKEDLKNNGDILSLTRPDVIEDIHRRFLNAGSDIVSTNSFSGTNLAQSEFFIEDPRKTGGIKDPEFFDSQVIDNPELTELVYELNYASAQLTRKACDDIGTDTGIKRYSAGAVGPLTVSLTNVVDPNDTSFRPVTFDQVKDDYRRQVNALIDGGIDILMVETIFDALNAKAALVACQEVFEERGQKLPLIISAAVGRGGETMISAQKIEALWNSTRHVDPLAIGLNCSLGPDLMAPFVEEISAKAHTHISVYPNAGLPNPLAPTGFDLEPHHMAEYTEEFAKKGVLNLMGGCCGNTPAHIEAIANAARGFKPRVVPNLK